MPRAKLASVGQVVVKVAGRESGRRCVIVDVIDSDFVLVTGPKDVSGVRRRRVNIDHLEFTGRSIPIKPGASDAEVKKILGEAGLLEEMSKVLVPTQVGQVGMRMGSQT